MTTSDIATLERALVDAQAKSHAAMDRRRALPPGSSRARVTTANANWARAAEQRDRCSERLDAARAAISAPTPMVTIPSYNVGATITLGRSTYTIARVSPLGLELRGVRGGETSLVQCQKSPTAWAHVQPTGGYRFRSTWYRQNVDGTFEAAS